MDKEQAQDKIIGEIKLPPLHRLVLQTMVKHTASDYLCPLTKTSISELVGVSWHTVNKVFKDLEQGGYLFYMDGQKKNGRYIPYPYCHELPHLKGDGQESRRLTITPQHGHYMMGLLGKEESRLSLQADTANSRGDRKEARAILQEIDMVTDLREILGKFVERTYKPVVSK